MQQQSIQNNLTKLQKKPTKLNSYNTQIYTQLYHQIITQTKKTFQAVYKTKYKSQPSIEQRNTVLCSLTLYNKQKQQKQIISISFGTKTLPQSYAKLYKSNVVKDMHAQILCKRGFIKYLIQKLPNKQEDNSIFIWDQNKMKHKLRQQYEVLLYTNQIFCGDCMVHQQISMFSGARPLKYFATDIKEIPQQKYMRYCLRTKPGRLDLPLDKRTLSLSCSDKICVFNVLGIQGKMLFNYIVPIYINKIILQTQRNAKKQRISQGIDLCYRIHSLFNKNEKTINDKLFKIVMDGQKRFITKQFRCNKPEIVIIGKQQYKQLVKDNQVIQTQKAIKTDKKLDLCGIICCNEISWLNGRTGLPQGVSLNKINKISPFCSEQLYKNLKSNPQQQFKYHAIKSRIKLLFGQWTDNFRKQN